MKVLAVAELEVTTLMMVVFRDDDVWTIACPGRRATTECCPRELFLSHSRCLHLQWALQIRPWTSVAKRAWEGHLLGQRQQQKDEKAELTRWGQKRSLRDVGRGP